MPRKPKLCVEEKVDIVRRCLKGEQGVCEAGRAAGVSHKTIIRWIARYETEGVEAFIPRERNRVYSAELKRQAVQEYLSGGYSTLELSKKYKISNPCIVEQWVKVYNTHGDLNSVKFSGGGSYMRKTRNTTQEERIQIVQDCIASGKNYGKTALKYEVSYQQVRTWTLRFEELGEAGLEDRRGKRKKDQTPRTELEKAQIEIEQLKHKLYLAEMERDLLKKLDEVVRRDVYRK